MGSEHPEHVSSAPGDGQPRWALGTPLLVAALALAVRLWQPGPTVRTVDELTWTARSAAFGQALAHGDWAAATTGPLGDRITRPGVTTMWAGYLGEKASDSPLPWVGSRDDLANGHALVSVLCVIGLWVFVVVAAQVVGRRAALVAGGLLAVEPTLVGHSALLHTDALVTMWASASVVALVATAQAVEREAAEGVPRRWWRAASSRLATVAGVAGAVAVLTKITAVILLGPAFLAVVALCAWSVHRGSRPPTRARRLGVRAVALVLFSGAAVALALWPALWVDPLANLGSLVDSARLSGVERPAFFMGTPSRGGDWRFFAVVGLLRTSAWLLLLGAVAVGWVIGARLRGRGPRIPRMATWSCVVPVAVYVVAISVSEKQYDRYLLPVVPFAALAVGSVLAQVIDDVPARSRTWARRAGWGGLAVAAAWTVSLAPFALSHVNPLAGGQRTAVDRIPLGWGEGREWAIQTFPELGAGPCPTVSSRAGLLYFCREGFEWLDDGSEPPDLVMVYVYQRQLGLTAPEERFLAEHGELLDALTIDGVSYVEIWDPDPES